MLIGVWWIGKWVVDCCCIEAILLCIMIILIERIVFNLHGSTGGTNKEAEMIQLIIHQVD